MYCVPASSRSRSGSIPASADLEGGSTCPTSPFTTRATSGDFVVVFGEVKTPAVEIADLALSTERDNQIGRYLASTGVVLLTNVRALGVLAVEPDRRAAGPVPPEHRRLLESVELWPSAAAMALPQALGLTFEGVEGEEAYPLAERIRAFPLARLYDLRPFCGAAAARTGGNHLHTAR